MVKHTNQLDISVFSSRYLRFIIGSRSIPNFPLPYSLLMWSRGQNIWKLGPPQLRLKWFCSACGSTASSQIIATRLRFLECRNTCRLKRGVRSETHLFFGFETCVFDVEWLNVVEWCGVLVWVYCLKPGLNCIPRTLCSGPLALVAMGSTELGGVGVMGNYHLVI